MAMAMQHSIVFLWKSVITLKYLVILPYGGVAKMVVGPI